MATYQPSKYYADDKDIHDILSSPKISNKSLLAQARRRGVFFSEETPREQIVHEMSKLPFSWDQVQDIMVEITREDRVEKLTTCKIATDTPVEQIQEAVQKVKEQRGEQLREDYTITEKDGRVQVKVVYNEPDFQKARLIQRREREVTLEISKNGKDMEVRHTQNERTNAILASIMEAMTPKEAEKKLQRKTIQLSGIKNHQHRTQFFINLIGGLEGFQLREVRDLKTDRFIEEEIENEESSDTEVIKRGDQLKALVRRVALSGENILISPQYQQLTADGFFITRVLWTSMETADKGRVFEFEAEFKDAQEAADFAYQVRGVYDRDKDGELSKSKSDLTDSERNLVRANLEASAYESVEKVEALQTDSKKA